MVEPNKNDISKLRQERHRLDRLLSQLNPRTRKMQTIHMQRTGLNQRTGLKDARRRIHVHPVDPVILSIFLVFGTPGFAAIGGFSDGGECQFAATAHWPVQPGYQPG